MRGISPACSYAQYSVSWYACSKVLDAYEGLLGLQTLHTGPTLAAHPADRKAICRLHLSSLQRTQGLSLEAAKYVALLCGPRYLLPSPAEGSL